MIPISAGPIDSRGGIPPPPASVPPQTARAPRHPDRADCVPAERAEGLETRHPKRGGGGRPTRGPPSGGPARARWGP